MLWLSNTNLLPKISQLLVTNASKIEKKGFLLCSPYPFSYCLLALYSYIGEQDAVEDEMNILNLLSDEINSSYTVYDMIHNTPNIAHILSEMHVR